RGHGDRRPSRSARVGGAAHDGLPASAAGTGRGRSGAGHSGASRGGGGGTGGLGGAAGGVVGCVGGGGLRRGQGTPGQAAGNTSLTGHSTPPAASPSPSGSSGPVTPAAFTGSWSGLVRQPPTDKYNVRVTLKAGQTHGTVRYSGTDFSCSGVLQLVSVTTA